MDAIELVARRICEEDGFDPDEEIIGGQATGFQNYGPRWQANHRSEGTLGITDYVALSLVENMPAALGEDESDGE